MKYRIFILILLFYLLFKNKKGYFKRNKVALFVFNMCEKLGLHAASKYLAIELLDK